jgi:hypothetical protein
MLSFRIGLGSTADQTNFLSLSLLLLTKFPNSKAKHNTSIITKKVREQATKERGRERCKMTLDGMLRFFSIERYLGF